MRAPEIPADIGAAQGFADWRKRVWWPVSVAEANQVCSTQTRRALAWAAGLDNALVRDAALLALPNILAYARAIVLASLAASRANAAGMQLIATAPEFTYLQGGGPMLPPARANPVLAQEYGLVGRLTREHRLGISVEACAPSEIAREIERMVADGPARFFDPQSAQRFAAAQTPGRFASLVLSV